MKNTSLKIKRFLVLTTIIVLVITNARAQETTTAQDTTTALKSYPEFTIGFNTYSLQYGCPTFQFRFFVDVSPKIAVGGGCGHDGWLYFGVNSESATVSPFCKFQTQAFNFGWALSAMYHFDKGHLELDGYFALCGYSFTAYDSRCEIEYDSDPGTSTTSWFTLYRADGKQWYSGFSYTLTLSYLLPITDRLHLKFAAGYDFTTPVKKELVNEATGLSSNWDEFETYYGQPTINLYETFEEVRRICSIGHFHVGFGLSFLL